MGKNDAVTVKDEAVEQRKLTGRSKQIIAFLAASVSVFHLYVAKFGILEALQMRALHLGLLLPFAFCCTPEARNRPGTRHRPSTSHWPSPLFSSVFMWDCSNTTG